MRVVFPSYWLGYWDSPSIQKRLTKDYRTPSHDDALSGNGAEERYIIYITLPTLSFWWLKRSTTSWFIAFSSSLSLCSCILDYILAALVISWFIFESDGAVTECDVAERLPSDQILICANHRRKNWVKASGSEIFEGSLNNNQRYLRHWRPLIYLLLDSSRLFM